MTGRSIAQVIQETLTDDSFELPVFSQVSMKVQQLLASGHASVQAIERLIAADQALSSSVLKAANSAFFSGLRQVETIGDAVVRMGMQKLSELVTLVAQKNVYQTRNPNLSQVMAKLWQHGVGTAYGAKWLAMRFDDPALAQQAFMAGLLHDVGKLAVLKILDGNMANTDAGGGEGEVAGTLVSDDLLLETMDTFHVEVGTTLMERWNLPDAYCEVIKFHHEETYDTTKPLITLVRFVDMACNKAGIGLKPPSDLRLEATEEARLLQINDILTAELEIALEDGLRVGGAV